MLAAAVAERAIAEASARAKGDARLKSAVDQGRALRLQLQESMGALQERDAALQVVSIFLHSG